ncbi:MAG: HD domain-containing protein [Clostridia bacterium]|nr:HD domain-containing protein [Clostridia bacterium]
MITETMLDALREQVASQMSPYRFRHTAEVEAMVERLAALYAPNASHWLRAAALLHDITKEHNTEEQIALFKRMGAPVPTDARLTPKTLHAQTAALVIPSDYPQFATAELLSAVRYHTTGRQGMTVEEWLLYLADYIDLSRTFPDCVRLRNFFWEAEPQRMTRSERCRHLRKTILLSLDMTISALVEEGVPISLDSVLARNALLVEEAAEA